MKAASLSTLAAFSSIKGDWMRCFAHTSDYLPFNGEGLLRVNPKYFAIFRALESSYQSPFELAAESLCDEASQGVRVYITAGDNDADAPCIRWELAEQNSRHGGRARRLGQYLQTKEQEP